MTAAVDQLGTMRRERAATPALRYALRELRGGFGGFYVFMSCIALGVFAIAGIGALAASLSASLVSEGRTLLGGDASFSLIQREATPDERAVLAAKGDVSVAATMRAMAKSTADQYALVELKAADPSYPMIGAVDLAPVLPLAAVLAAQEGSFGAAADATLLARLSRSQHKTTTLEAADIAELAERPAAADGGLKRRAKKELSHEL